MSATDIICITGSAQKELDHVAAILANAGMSASAAVSGDRQLDFALWHQKVVAAAEKGTQLNQQIVPGRLWEQLAGNLFVANMQAELWGWADSHSIWLQDFWLNFEPNVKFILVCVSPQQVLADMLANNPSPSDADLAVEATIKRWLDQHREMLRFHNRHPQRSMLVAADDCRADPEALVLQCQDKWQLPLTKPNAAFDAPATADAVYRYLAEQLCRDIAELDSLNNELAATMTRFAEEEALALSVPVEHVIAHYQTQQGLHAEADTSARQLTQSLEQALEQERNAHAQLAQEHQTRLQQLDRERDEQTRLATERQAQVDQLNAQYAAQAQQLQELTGKLEQSTREQATLSKAKADAEQACSNAEQKIKNAEDKLRIAEDKVKSTEEKLRESNEENELLLLQLHQVQEELEHYFLRHQEAQNQLKLAEDKWQQMMLRNPDYCEYAALELISDDKDPQGPPRWRFKDLQIAGRSFAELEFGTLLERGIAGLVFARQPEPAGPLVRWPTVAYEHDELAVIPVAQDNNRKQRVETLFDLATGDWQLMKALAAVMAKELSTTGSSAQAHFAAHQAEQLTPLQAGLHEFKAILDAFPAKFRFDTLVLKHEQVNPGYEHLWLRCENVACDEKSWPAFEFRLACANVTPDSFGNDPKLEFPQVSDATTLTGWFAESQDHFGEKLELRFALPNAMDVEVWQQLPGEDQQFITALMERLPAMLETLRNMDTTLQRPWDDWIEMSRAMAGIFAERTAPARRPAVEEEVEP